MTPYREGKLLAPTTFQLGLSHPRLRIGLALCVATVRFAIAIALLPFLTLLTLMYARDGRMVSNLGMIAGRFGVFPKLLWATPRSSRRNAHRHREAPLPARRGLDAPKGSNS